MSRFRTTVEGNTIYLTDGQETILVGDLDQVIETVGGYSWTISYSAQQKERYSNLDTSDEGLTIDVVDTINAMTFSASFVATLKAQPFEPIEPDTLSPRLGLFIGRLLENLEFGVR